MSPPRASNPLVKEVDLDMEAISISLVKSSAFSVGELSW
jgi:hypothetical protein